MKILIVIVVLIVIYVAYTGSTQFGGTGTPVKTS